MLCLSRDTAAWLFDETVQKLLALLSKDGGEARVVGGAVRNTLLGQPISDVDIATTLSPEEVMRRARAADFGVVETGVDFGTLTVVVDHRSFEVTSLRRDIETNGRHAVVIFGQDWQCDARRRDFTINALYCDRAGRIYDEVGGLEDIQTRQIRFIGDAQARISEDYLRILRFFRFFAYYGSGRPDAQALKAAARLKEGLLHLSAERIWSELKKILGAPDPVRALLWMRQSGILSLIIPESDKWGIDAIPALIKNEKERACAADPLLRLMAILPPDVSRIQNLAARLKLSQSEKKRLMNWADMMPIRGDCSPLQLKKLLYCQGKAAVVDKLMLALCVAGEADATGYDALLDIAQNWQRPHFPLRGQDLIAAGITSGPEIGRILKKLEEEWMVNGFHLDFDQFDLKSKIKLL